VSAITQTEFDQLATFVAVAEELSMEPFLSEDNHEGLVQAKDSTGATIVTAHFCHPAFLKSAIMPFRRLWLSSEICAFENVRDLVFRVYPNQKLAESYRYWFYNFYSERLDEPADKEWAVESRHDILDIWIYTQAAHAGKKQYRKGKTVGRFSLSDFDQWAERIGRERFEWLIRTSVRAIGYDYIQFLEKLAAPLFRFLQQECKMKPGFEASAALKYNPYPDPRYRITFDDVFWHLDKESVEETFSRVLARPRYTALQSFLLAYFGSKPEALAAVSADGRFSEMTERTGGVLLDKQQDQNHRVSASYTAGYGASPHGAVKFEVYRERKFFFFDRSGEALTGMYADFRGRFFEERRRQRREHLDR
jgi:hypothetical protein